MTGKELLGLMLQGGPGFCQIAVTNACNAGCFPYQNINSCAKNYSNPRKSRLKQAQNAMQPCLLFHTLNHMNSTIFK